MSEPLPIFQTTPSSVDQVFERLVEDIVSERYGNGSRLPAERELSATLSCSRSTLREALGRLAGWGLVDIRRGSGIVVRPNTEWSMYVLPAWLRYAAPATGPEAMGKTITALLEVRRTIFVDIIHTMAARVSPLRLHPARAAARDAWAARDDHATFVQKDFEVIRALARAADFLPGLWILNSFSEVYFELATLVTLDAAVPDNYGETWELFFRTLDEGDVDAATAHVDAYLRAHDDRLLANLGVQR